MKHSSIKTRVILAVAAIFVLFVSSSNIHAQQNTYKRGVLFEEFTGIWCYTCPLGAWAIDTMEKKYGDNLVILAYHGPSGYGEPLAVLAEDTITSAYSVTSYPTGLMDRAVKNLFGVIPAPYDYPVWASYTSIDPELNSAPSVDFRLVNAAYDPNTKKVSFDLDITPFDMTKMRTDDTAQYSTVTALTEDNVISTEAQQWQGEWDKVPDPNAIDDFHHMNVVRMNGGGAFFGDNFTLGTKTPNEALPIRRHYSMTVKAGWDPTQIRAKGFVQVGFPKPQAKITGFNVLEAKQTGYVTTLPTTPQNAVWVVLPATDNTITTSTARIVWAKGGNVQSVKLQYTTDGGSTWTLIPGATNVTTSPYVWTHGFTSDATVMVRASDANDANTFGTSGMFSISPPAGSYTITKPSAGETIVGGTANYAIKYTAQNAGTTKTFSFSSDGGNTWAPITGTSQTNTYVWTTVPDVATTQGMIKISDELSVEGVSGMFTITQKASGAITSLTLGGVVNNSIKGGSQMDITWLSSGNIGSGFTVEYSLDNQGTWNAIKSLPATSYEALWTTPTGDYTNCYVRVRSADADKSSIYAISNQFAITSSAGVSDNSTNGYSITNYPNPFGSQTTVKFTIPVATSVTFNVLDNLGRVVDHMVSKTLEPGDHTILFNGAELANGVYTYTLEAGSVRLVGKMSIAK